MQVATFQEEANAVQYVWDWSALGTHQALDLRLVLFQPDEPLEQRDYLCAVITLTPHLHSKLVLTIHSPSAKSSCSCDKRHAVQSQVMNNVTINHASLLSSNEGA